MCVEGDPAITNQKPPPAGTKTRSRLARALAELMRSGGAENQAPRPVDRRIPDLSYRSPQDLAVTPTILRRVIVVGSCMANRWPEVFKNTEPPCPCDLFLFNNASQLPKDPPHAAEDYDFQVIQVPIRSVLPDSVYFDLPNDDLATYEKLFTEAKSRLSQNLEAALRWNREHGLLSFVCNFNLPQQNPMGRLLPRYDLRNLVYFIEQLNQALVEELARYDNAYLLDVDQLVSTYGRRYFQDDVLCQSNHGGALSNAGFARDQERLEPLVEANKIYPTRLYDYLRIMRAEVIAMYRTIRQIDMVKLVIMDIDDTLWRGVAAESAEHSSSAIVGWPLGVVDALGYLKRRGVLLAIVSKNDENRIKEIWQQIIGRHLSLDDFAARRINWNTKVENIQDLLRNMNLLPRNVLFIDDNPVERASVKAAFPDIRVLGPNPYVWRRILLWSAETQVSTVTTESAARSDMMRAQVERETQRQQMSREEFLASLSLEFSMNEINDLSHSGFPRALELINKTNQFNTTGRRWTTQECAKAFDTGTKFHVFNVRDRFTAYGIVGVIVLKGSDIEQFVMSCRVAGLDVESAAIAQVLRLLRESGRDKARAALVETDVNLLCRDVYERCGFERKGKLYERALDPVLESPPHIRVIESIEAAAV